MIVVDDKRFTQRITLTAKPVAAFNFIILERVVRQHLDLALGNFAHAGRTDPGLAREWCVKVICQRGFQHRLSLGHGKAVVRAVDLDRDLCLGLTFAALGHLLLCQTALLAFAEQLKLDLVRL